MKVRPDWTRVGPNAMTVSLKEERRAPQIPQDRRPRDAGAEICKVAAVLR